jgi:hypothetical protein
VFSLRVQIHDTKQQLRLELADGTATEINMADAVQLARDLIDAVTQCGHEVKITVDVPRHQPTDMQIATAITRIGHLRKTLDGRAPWNDVKANQEFVMRVLEVCL